jgi:hypothetical protein
VFAKKSRRGWSSPCGTHGGRRRHGARARRGGGRFYSRVQGGEGGFLAYQGNQVMAWAAAWPEYGAREGGGGRRRAACMPARGWLGGAARYGSIAAHGREARGAKEEGGAWTSGQKPASACGRARSRRGWRVTPARRRALWTTGLKPFRLTPFDRAFLQLFQLKWTKRSTAKL